jgi:hypothetical protein
MRDTGMRNERELFRMRIENMDWTATQRLPVPKLGTATTCVIDLPKDRQGFVRFGLGAADACGNRKGKARTSEIDIPVYQADSVLTPSRGTNLFEGDVYPLKPPLASHERITTQVIRKGRMIRQKHPASIRFQ